MPLDAVRWKVTVPVGVPAPRPDSPVVVAKFDVGTTRAVNVTGAPTGAGFGLVTTTVAVPILRVTGGLSEYHPVPVNVNRNVTFLHASWLTVGQVDESDRLGHGHGERAERRHDDGPGERGIAEVQVGRRAGGGGLDVRDAQGRDGDRRGQGVVDRVPEVAGDPGVEQGRPRGRGGRAADRAGDREVRAGGQGGGLRASASCWAGPPSWQRGRPRPGSEP